LPTLSGVEISGRNDAAKFSPNEKATFESTKSASPSATSPGPTNQSAMVPRQQAR